MRTYTLLAVFIFTISSYSYAKNLSNKAIFYRCYSMITQRQPDAKSSIVTQVSNGQLDPIDACMSVLNKANLTANGNTRIASTTNREAINVLTTIHQLHYGFMDKKGPNEGVGYYRHVKDNVDPNGPSLFFTKAFFTPNYKFADIFKNNIQYESERANKNPTSGPYTRNNTKYYTDRGFTPQWIDTGDLHGVRTLTQKRIPWKYPGNASKNGTAFFDHSWGGGIIGSYNYILQTLEENINFSATNGNNMPRRWTRSVLKDFMCRELPVVRYDDATPFVSNNSPLGFRQDLACIRCHATMDRMAGVIRNVRPQTLTTSGLSASRFAVVNKWTTSRAAETSWEPNNIASYHTRPLNGHFYYRTFDGKLIDRKVSGGNALGVVIADLEDPYVCMAKKYYQYFTGIDANVDDIADPQYGRKLSTDELKHRDQVISFGKRFKTHQSLKQLAEEILRSSQFKYTGD